MIIKISAPKDTIGFEVGKTFPVRTDSYSLLQNATATVISTEDVGDRLLVELEIIDNVNLHDLLGKPRLGTVSMASNMFMDQLPSMQFKIPYTEPRNRRERRHGKKD
jgi:hypothetical protein